MPTKYGRESSVEWADYGISPVRGLCPYITETGGLEKDGGCTYCYMKGFFKRFHDKSKRPLNPELRPSDDMYWWPPRRTESLKVAVCLNLDLFHPDVPDEWIRTVIQTCWERLYQQYQVTYIFLTKCPERYAAFDFHPNCWLGTTRDGLPYTEHNVQLLSQVNTTKEQVRFVSFEPLLKLPPAGILTPLLKSESRTWVIIGADSRRGAKKPPLRWADQLIDEAHFAGIAVWVKDNLGYYKEIKEYPERR